MTDVFGDLRSLAHGTPSRQAFASILRLLVHAEDAGDDARVEHEWVPYLDGALSHWPDDARACPDALAKSLEVRPLPWGRLVRTLDYREGRLGAKRVGAIAAAEHLAHITRLDLRAAHTTWQDLELLVDSAPFTRLESFALRKSSSSGADARVFTKWLTSPMMAHLEELHLSGWARFNASAAKLVWANLPLGALRVLDLSDTRIGKTQLRRLFALEELTSLEVLDLARVEFNAAATRALAEGTHLTSLRELVLDECRIDLSGLDTLEGAAHIANLERLNLSTSELSIESLDVLATAGPFPSLRVLTIEDDTWLEELATWMHAHAECFPALAVLECAAVGFDTLLPLARGGLDAVRAVRLDELPARVTLELDELHQTEWFARLDALSMRGVLTGEGAPGELRLPRAPRYLDLSENHFEDGQLERTFDGVDTSRLEVLLLERLGDTGRAEVHELLMRLELPALRVLDVTRSVTTRGLREVVEHAHMPSLDVVYHTEHTALDDLRALRRAARQNLGARIGNSWGERPSVVEWSAIVDALAGRRAR